MHFGIHVADPLQQHRLLIYQLGAQRRVIARKNAGVNSSFTVRKISHGEGVERVFPLYSPRVESVQLVRKGNVRRAKLYYLRGLTGKAARITEKLEAETAAE